MIPDDRDALIKVIDGAKTIAETRDLADEIMALADINKQRISLVAGNHVNPFFVPRQNPQSAPLNSLQAMYFLSQLRMSAANGRCDRIVVSAPMKSGSTFIAQALYMAFRLLPTNLMMLTTRPYDHVLYGANTRPHEIDEMALLHACLGPQGFVAHHHMLCTPFLAKQAELYGLKFILLKRNIFDCIVSLDDFCRKNLSGLASGADLYLRMQLPPDWARQPDEGRVRLLLDRFLPIYVNYHVSWKLLESQGMVSPLWISYEDELLADKTVLATRLCEWLGKTTADVDRLASELNTGRDPAQFHFNKGVAGRGAVIQGANRQRVLDAFNDFKDLADWSEILD
jgi:hypothetical protein